MQKFVSVLILLFLITSFSSDIFAEDSDYGSTAEFAEPIDQNGTPMFGTITTGDEDWFTFENTGYGHYRISLASRDTRHIHCRAYWKDEFGDLNEFTAIYWVYDSTSSVDVFLEAASECYIMVYAQDIGDYHIRGKVKG